MAHLQYVCISVMISFVIFVHVGFIRPYMGFILLAGFVRYLISGEFVHGSLYGLVTNVISENLKELHTILHLHTIDVVEVTNILSDAIVALGVYGAFLISSCIYTFICERYALGSSSFFFFIQDTLFGLVRNFSLVANEIEKEKAKFSADIDKDLKAKARAITDGVMSNKLPTKGRLIVILQCQIGFICVMG